jgi:hypothetical protein
MRQNIVRTITSIVRFILDRTPAERILLFLFCIFVMLCLINTSIRHLASREIVIRVEPVQSSEISTTPSSVLVESADQLEKEERA